MSGIAQQPGPELGQTAKVKTPIPPASAQTLRDALGTRDTLPDHVALLDDLSPAYGGRVAQLTTDWHVGATISERYFITRHLGSGAMGEVYLAQDTLLDKQVALKVLHPDIAGDRSNVQRFLREVALAQSITHANVVRIFDTGEAHGLPFMTMELLRGQTLEELCESNRHAVSPMPIDEVVEIICDILGGLAAIHEAGIIHRDLKPANVMLTHRGAIVMDFGVAGIARSLPASDFAELSRASSSFETDVGTIFGSPAYMAPELWERVPASASSDLYSVGVIAFQLLSGRLPFDGATPQAYVHNAQSKDPHSLSLLRKDIPRAFRRFVQNLIASTPEVRPGSAELALRRLSRRGRLRRILVATLPPLLCIVAVASWTFYNKYLHSDAWGLAGDRLAADDLRGAVRLYDLGDYESSSRQLERIHQSYPASAALAFWRATLAQDLQDERARQSACASREHWQGNDTWISRAHFACGSSYLIESAPWPQPVIRLPETPADMLPIALHLVSLPRLEGLSYRDADLEEHLGSLRAELAQPPDWSDMEFALPTRWDLARIELELAIGDLQSARARMHRALEHHLDAPSVTHLAATLESITGTSSAVAEHAQRHRHADPRAYVRWLLDAGRLAEANAEVVDLRDHPAWSAVHDMWCAYAFRYGESSATEICQDLQPGLTHLLWNTKASDRERRSDLLAMRPVERLIWENQQALELQQARARPAHRIIVTLARPPFETYLRQLDIALELADTSHPMSLTRARKLAAELIESAPGDPWGTLARANVAAAMGESRQALRERKSALAHWSSADELPLLEDLRASVETPAHLLESEASAASVEASSSIEIEEPTDVATTTHRSENPARDPNL